MKVSVVLIEPTQDHDHSALADALQSMAGDIEGLFAPPGWDEIRDVPVHEMTELSMQSPQATSARSPAEALSAALHGVRELVDPNDDHWLWILSPAHVPQPGALAAMVRTAKGSSRVAIVGPKIVTAQDKRKLVTVGHRITSWGRSADFTTAGVFDQGQCDETSDVIGVPITGMLMKSSVITQIGGIQPTLDVAVAGLDLSWRAHAQGHRVVAAPDAVLSHDLAASGELGRWDPRATPPEQRHVASHYVSLALARTPWWKLPFRALAMLGVSLLTLLVWVLARRPKAAALAVSEAAGVLALGRMVRARRGGTGRTVGERDLAGLFYPSRGASARARFTRLDGPAEPADAPRVAAAGGRSVQAIESGPVSDEASSLDDSQGAPRARWWSWPAAAALLVSIAATALGWRGLGAALRPQSWGVQGSEIATSSADASSLWASWASGWSGTGLGEAGQGPMWFVPLAGWTWIVEQLPAGPDGGNSAMVATAWLLLAAMPLSALTAYGASARALPARWPRAVLALGWAGLAPLAGALDDGRLGPAVVHIVAPLVVAGTAGSLRPGRAGTSAAFGTTLLVAFGAMFVPVLLGVGIAGGLVVLIAAPGWWRLRGILLGAAPLLLLGPEVVAIVSEPALAFGGAGATVSGEPTISAAWALMLHPSGPVSLALWWVVPAWLLVLIAILDPGRVGAGRPAMGLSIAALVGIASAIAVSGVVVGEVPLGHPDAGAPVTTWPGSLLSVAGAAVLLAAAHGVRSVIAARSRALAQTPKKRQALAASCSVMLAIAAASAVATIAVHSIVGTVAGLSAATAPVPAVVAERAEGPEGLRLIALTPQAAPQSSQGYLIGYSIVSDEPRPWLRDRSADLTSAASDDQDSPIVSTALAALADDTDTSVIDPAPLEEALADLAVGYVSVQAEAEHPVVEQLDRLPSLIRVNSPPGEELWRVRPSAVGSRVWWQGADGRRLATAAMSGAHATGQASVPEQARVLAVAEPLGWAQAARVSVDGQVIGLSESEFPRYELPEGAQRVKIELPTPHAPWWWASAIGGALLLLLSAPVLARGHRS